MIRRLISFGLLVLAMTFCSTAVVMADSLRSTHYEFTETSLGGSGLNDSSSTNFQSRQSVGILGNGSTASANFQTATGNITTSDPALAFSVDQDTVSLGAFSPGSATVTTSTFQVINYTSYGYIVQIFGTPPTGTGGHVISGMTSTGPSVSGTDQFGINLVANTSPTSVGANPDHGQFGFGSAAPNYDTANNYRYVSGETIASAPKSSGLTTYTISYLVNVNTLTPGGLYTSDQTIICTGTY